MPIPAPLYPTHRRHHVYDAVIHTKRLAVINSHALMAYHACQDVAPLCNTHTHTHRWPYTTNRVCVGGCRCVRACCVPRKVGGTVRKAVVTVARWSTLSLATP